MDLPNFIQTANPFSLATPPAWFLAQLHAYDPLFVVFPSETEPVYRLGRRGRYGHGMLNVLKDIPDTKIFVANAVWPWKSLLPQGVSGFSWARILQDIPNYDTQRFKDPAGHLDAREAKEEAEIDARIADGADQLAGDMYRTMKLIEGSRVGSGKTPEGAGYKKLGQPRARRRRVHRPVNSGAGALWVGR